MTRSGRLHRRGHRSVVLSHAELRQCLGRTVLLAVVCGALVWSRGLTVRARGDRAFEDEDGVGPSLAQCAAMSNVLRYAAFTTDPSGGNPAGVVLDASTLDEPAMQALAADLGYSETAFLTHVDDGVLEVRYFSPAAEVPFCGHATIATAVALAERDGPGSSVFRTRSGDVAVDSDLDDVGLYATSTSVEPCVELVDEATVDEALGALDWARSDLHLSMPPRVASAGARHLILVAATRQRLAALDYDFERLRRLMLAEDWTTVHLAWPESVHLHHARNPFPVGGVVEDPATGAAAAAYGAYLRDLGYLTAPARLVIHQGDDLGRPSRLMVDVAAGDSRIRLSGHAVRITP